MQIVIDIPDRMYQNVLDGTYCGTLYEELKNGTPLPKGHGRILDEKDILDVEKNEGLIYDLVDMPDYIADVSAIIEADKEGEDNE